MSAQIIVLPPEPSYITIRPTGSCWCVDLVTPCEGRRPIRSALTAPQPLDIAISYARDAAEGLGRPLRLPGGAK